MEHGREPGEHELTNGEGPEETGPDLSSSAEPAESLGGGVIVDPELPSDRAQGPA